MATERYLCIHGHFYQPPRENPWLEAIELQDSAYPYHDWNERITAESYAPNMASRILDGEGRITQIVNNYARISFNIGPTLMAWLEEKAPDVYEAILEADGESQARFSGHGSALAQAYNHMILPLANQRDVRTQVLWGIRDFEHRFGRRPEGMWLPETAVNLEALEVLAELGIAFTVLAPDQARRVRPLAGGPWEEVGGGRIDPTRAYRQRLPSGRSIALFFYDGPISRAVAFEGLLRSGEGFAQRLQRGYAEGRTGPQLVHIATDGETYGHHHRFGDMALAYALHHVEANGLARITNYGEFLALHPPTHEVEILENTSWSCPHGVERWRSNCGCNTGGHSGWHQEWRAPLRAALDWLRDTLTPLYEVKAAELLTDPWAARDDYIEVILDRSAETVDRFLARHARSPLTRDKRVRALKLLELQRQAMLVYTSCGWFFDDLSGIETVQVLQYAGRAVQLAQELFGEQIETQFLDRLQEARSNVPAEGDGRRIYERSVVPAILDWGEVAAHYAISSLFRDYGEEAAVYSYRVELEDYRRFEAGTARLALGRARFTSTVTEESSLHTFGVLHFGNHSLNCSVRAYRGPQAYQAMVSETTGAFQKGEFPEVIRLMDTHFGKSNYSLRHLFRDEQRRVLDEILGASLSQAEAAYRQQYDEHAPLMRFLTDLGIPLPRVFRTAAEYYLNTSLRQHLSTENLDTEGIKTLLADAEALRVDLDAEGLGFTFTQTLEEMMARFAAVSEDFALLRLLAAAAALVKAVPFEVNLWNTRNIYFQLLQTTYTEFRERAQQGDEGAAEWVAQFTALGGHLSIRVP